MKPNSIPKILLVLFPHLFFSGSLYSQFSGYTQAESSSYNAALFSNGTGIRDSMSNIHGNPAFLMSYGKHLLESGATTLQSQNAVGPIILNGGGFYQLTESLGMGIRLKPVYSRLFPADERLVNYTGQAVLSYKINEIFYLGAGVGPTVSNRPGGYSSYSWNLMGSVGMKLPGIHMGLTAESPGANRFQTYLGSEVLKERYPDRISFGIQFEVGQWGFLYGEIVRMFWERAVFSQNGLEEKPPFPIRTSYSGSIGFCYHILSNFDMLFGFTKFSNPNSNGSLDPVYGLSAGLKSELFPSVFGPGIFGSLYVQRTGIRKTIEPYEPETRFGFQLQVQYDTKKDDIN